MRFEKVRTVLGKSQKFRPLRVRENGRLGGGKLREDPDKAPLTPAVFVFGNEVLSLIVKAVEKAAVFLVLAPGKPEAEEVIYQFVLIEPGKRLQ